MWAFRYLSEPIVRNDGFPKNCSAKLETPIERFVGVGRDAGRRIAQGQSRALLGVQRRRRSRLLTEAGIDRDRALELAGFDS